MNTKYLFLILLAFLAAPIHPSKAGSSFPPCKMCEVKKVRHTSSIRKKNKPVIQKQAETTETKTKTN